MFLSNELHKISDYIPHFEKSKKEISKVSIGWHLDHSLRVIIGICKALVKSDPSEYQWAFNVKRSYVFLRGGFPRGIGKAPKSVLPKEDITKESLISQIEFAKSALDTISALPSKSNFQHPYFGILNLKDAKKFLEIHTRHHLKIIDDIQVNKSI